MRARIAITQVIAATLCVSLYAQSRTDSTANEANQPKAQRSVGQFTDPAHGFDWPSDLTNGPAAQPCGDERDAWLNGFIKGQQQGQLPPKEGNYMALPPRFSMRGGDRFTTIKPTRITTVDGYQYAADAILQILKQMPKFTVADQEFLKARESRIKTSIEILDLRLTVLRALIKVSS